MRLLKLKVEIDLAILEDIENKKRLQMIEDGIIKSISKGLYEGISFNIKKFNFHQNN